MRNWESREWLEIKFKAYFRRPAFNKFFLSICFLLISDILKDSSDTFFKNYGGAMLPLLISTIFLKFSARDVLAKPFYFSNKSKTNLN